MEGLQSTASEKEHRTCLNKILLAMYSNNWLMPSIALTILTKQEIDLTLVMDTKTARNLHNWRQHHSRRVRPVCNAIVNIKINTIDSHNNNQS